MAITAGENCYVTYAEADAYFADRLHTEVWNGAGAVDCEKALIMATRRVDALPFCGRKADMGQKLQFPRVFGRKMCCDGCAEPVPAVPQAVKDAVCEEALEILKGPDRRAELRAAGVKSFKIGSLSEDLGGGSIGLASPEARALLAPFMGVAAID